MGCLVYFFCSVLHQSDGTTEGNLFKGGQVLNCILILLALNALQYCTRLDSLPEIWCYQRNQDLSDLQAKFLTIILTNRQWQCCHWHTLLSEADTQDDNVMSAMLDLVKVLCHCVAAMGIMGEVDEACHGLYQLERWLGHQLKSDEIKIYALNHSYQAL